jgi:hypothetical protein
MWFAVAIAVFASSRIDATDAAARYLKNRQFPDGHWPRAGHRPPLGSTDIQVTAMALRALQAFAVPTQRADYERAVSRAATWLRKAEPETTADQAFRLLGLAWAGGHDDVIRDAARALLELQRPDGSFSQLPSLDSDAFATGQAVVALHQSGALSVKDPAYRRGVEFLLARQLADGSWYVKSRSIPFQPYFESDFPHGQDQWISAAATNWATLALTAAGR